VISTAPQPEGPVTRRTDGASAPAEGGLCARITTFSRSLLADGEVIILELKPSPWFIPLVSGPVVVLGIIVLLAADLPLVSRAVPSWQTVLRYAGAWIMGLRLFWAILQWVGRVYVLTDRRVICQRGVLNIQVFECRLDRVQNTFIQRTVLQRILGIGTVFFATAGTGAVEAMWQHIRRPAEVHREIDAAIERFRQRHRNNSL